MSVMLKGTIRRAATVAALLTLVVVAVAEAHDMFLRPIRYFLEPNSATTVHVLNGTFSLSENSIDRNRLADIAVVSPAGRARIDTAQWGVKGDTSTFEFKAGAAGTYVLGASTKPNFIALSAKEFNSYLSDDGIPDVLEARRRSGEMEKPARERYSKHVKAIVQVGGARSAGALEPLGYPAELVPLTNPYELKAGDTLSLRALVGGKPVAGQFTLFGGRTANGARIAPMEVRTNADGVARIRIASAGVWYVKFIHMARVTGDTVDFESRWASLTFQVR